MKKDTIQYNTISEPKYKSRKFDPNNYNLTLKNNQDYFRKSSL